MYYVSIFAIGVLFSLGLGLSGMTQPEKVTGFLNVTGGENWDPSLIMVMLGAVTTFFVAQWLIMRTRKQAMCGHKFELPTNRTIDSRLIGGAATFGIGWGLIGFCPGPALVASTGEGGHLMWIFLVSMSAGMYLYSTLDQRFKEQPDGGAGIMDAAPANDKTAVEAGNAEPKTA